MHEDWNPQAAQMADESMVRNLSAQADALWPQERPLFARYRLDDGACGARGARILDAGCGTGEITRRLAEQHPDASLLGIDILDGPLALARERAEAAGVLGEPRLRFERRSIFDTGLHDDGFDLTVCRHVLQAIPHADRAIAELVRVTRPGGRLHLLVEDYGMMHFPVRRLDPDPFWHDGPVTYAGRSGTDLRIGRHAYRILRQLGLRDITVDYLVIDTLRVPRATFAAIWTAWRDGYAEAIAAGSRFTGDEVRAHFDGMIAAMADEDDYAVWHIPVLSAVVP